MDNIQKQCETLKTSLSEKEEILKKLESELNEFKKEYYELNISKTQKENELIDELTIVKKQLNIYLIKEEEMKRPNKRFNDQFEINGNPVRIT